MEEQKDWIYMKYNEILSLPSDFPVNSSEGRHKQQYIPEQIAKIAWEEYNKKYPGQSFERIKERGGFGWFELIALLYKRILSMESSYTHIHIPNRVETKQFGNLQKLEDANNEIRERANLTIVASDVGFNTCTDDLICLNCMATLEGACMYGCKYCLHCGYMKAICNEHKDLVRSENNVFELDKDGRRL